MAVGVEVKQGLKRMWFPISDRRGRDPISGILAGVWVSLKSSQAHQVLSQVITLKMWQDQAVSPQGYVCFQRWNSTGKMGTFLSFSLSVPNGSRKEEEEGNLHIKKNPPKTEKPFEVLKWAWSRPIGISPPPLPRRSSYPVPLHNGEVWGRTFNPQMQLKCSSVSKREKNKSLLLPCCLTGIFLEQETEWLPMCQWQKVLRAVLGRALGRE